MCAVGLQMCTLPIYARLLPEACARLCGVVCSGAGGLVRAPSDCYPSSCCPRRAPHAAHSARAGLCDFRVLSTDTIAAFMNINKPGACTAWDGGRAGSGSYSNQLAIYLANSRARGLGIPKPSGPRDDISALVSAMLEQARCHQLHVELEAQRRSARTPSAAHEALAGVRWASPTPQRWPATHAGKLEGASVAHPAAKARVERWHAWSEREARGYSSAATRWPLSARPAALARLCLARGRVYIEERQKDELVFLAW
jgi:hypothetical protein